MLLISDTGSFPVGLILNVLPKYHATSPTSNSNAMDFYFTNVYSLSFFLHYLYHEVEEYYTRGWTLYLILYYSIATLQYQGRARGKYFLSRGSPEPCHIDKDTKDYY